MGKITDQPAATLPLAGSELLTIVQSGENRQTTADAVNFTRPPIPHADTHSTGGTDELTPGDIGAATAIHQHTLADVTDSGTAAGYDVGLGIGELVELVDVGLGVPGMPAIDGSLLTGLGPGQTNLSVPQGEITATTLNVRSDTGTDATIPARTVTTAGLMTRDDGLKLDGIEDGATANQSDGYLLSRSNHTGTQDSQSVTLSSGQRLLGRWSAGSGVSELIQIGANLTLSAGVLSATAATVDSLDDLGDVTLTSPQDSQVLAFDSASGQWINAPAPSGGGGTVTQVDGGAGLTGSVTTSGALSVGAGTGITVGADSISINRAVTDGWYGTVTSVGGGNGLTGNVTTSGNLNVGAGEGITVGPDDVRINRTATDSWYYTKDAANAAFATAAQGGLADTAIQPTDNLDTLNDVTYGSLGQGSILYYVDGLGWMDTALYDQVVSIGDNLYAPKLISSLPPLP